MQSGVAIVAGTRVGDNDIRLRSVDVKGSFGDLVASVDGVLACCIGNFSGLLFFECRCSFLGRSVSGRLLLAR